MFKNYLKITVRNLLRNKGNAAITIEGLATGIAVCLTIFIIIQYQTSFDGFHSKKDLGWGKIIKLQSGGFMFIHSTDVLKVTGILASIPVNTDFQFKRIVSGETSYIGYMLAHTSRWDETTANFCCYLPMPQGVTAGNFNRQLMIVIAFVIAAPLAWYYMDAWLQNYVYRGSISAWIFATGLYAALFTALFTVNYQAIKAATANPVKSLRTQDRNHAYLM